MAFENLTSKLNSVFSRLKGKGKLNEQDIKSAMREVRLALLEADVNYIVAKELVADISERANGAEVMESLTPAQQVIKIVNEELTRIMGQGASEIKLNSTGVNVIMMVGLQGSGKTTHAAKLAKMFKDKGRRPMLAACDVYRPAAIEQLKIVGEKAGAPVFEMGQGDPVEIARRAYNEARDHGYDILIIDTAGRLQIDDQLMEELEKIKEGVRVNETLLVVDAMTGQEAVNIAKGFAERTGIDGIILTKLDGDTRGGAALSVLAVTGKPIKYAGIGEKIEDLEVFHPDRMASRILGMGDVLSFIEKAEKTIDEKKAAEVAQKMKKGLDMNDLLDQFEQIHKMGGAAGMLAMLPGGAKYADGADDAVFDRFKAIIFSMTKKEREKPQIINPQRKRRIAAGSGTTVEEVNRLLKSYEQMNKMVKQMNKKGKRRSGMGFGGLRGFGF